MTNDPFDLERVRRRWALAASTSAKARAPAAAPTASPAATIPASPAAATPPTAAPPSASSLAASRPFSNVTPVAKGTPSHPSPAPFDPFDRARGDLLELRRALAADLGPEARTAVDPFLRRVEQAVTQIETAHAATPPADPKALRAELDDALFDLEDLLEAFTIVAK